MINKWEHTAACISSYLYLSNLYLRMYIYPCYFSIARAHPSEDFSSEVSFCKKYPSIYFCIFFSLYNSYFFVSLDNFFSSVVSILRFVKPNDNPSFITTVMLQHLSGEKASYFTPIILVPWGQLWHGSNYLLWQASTLVVSLPFHSVLFGLSVSYFIGILSWELENGKRRAWRQQKTVSG